MGRRPLAAASALPLRRPAQWEMTKGSGVPRDRCRSMLDRDRGRRDRLIATEASCTSGGSVTSNACSEAQNF